MFVCLCVCPPTPLCVRVCVRASHNITDCQIACVSVAAVFFLLAKNTGSRKVEIWPESAPSLYHKTRRDQHDFDASSRLRAIDINHNTPIKKRFGGYCATVLHYCMTPGKKKVRNPCLSLCHGVYRFSCVVRTSTKKQKDVELVVPRASPLALFVPQQMRTKTQRELNTSTVNAQLFFLRSSCSFASKCEAERVMQDGMNSTWRVSNQKTNHPRIFPKQAVEQNVYHTIRTCFVFASG